MMGIVLTCWLYSSSKIKRSSLCSLMEVAGNIFRLFQKTYLCMAKTERKKLSKDESITDKVEDVADIIFEPPTPSKFLWL